MISKELKYKELLAKFPNCPPEEYKEIKKEAFRWIHEIEHENDFKPLHLIKDPPQKMLDDSDLMCIGHGLSLFDSFINANNKYKDLYTNKRKNKRIDFVNDVGNNIAKLAIDYSDGIANHPNNTGHFTFHEYNNVTLKEKIQSFFYIFDSDGNFII